MATQFRAVYFVPCAVCRPDISAIRDRAAQSTSNTNQLTTLQFQPPALEDLEAPRRQTSLDGEAIKIIIHDVDSGPFLASKRRVMLRRDPTDKAHRSNFLDLVAAVVGVRLANFIYFSATTSSSWFWNACGWRQDWGRWPPIRVPGVDRARRSGRKDGLAARRQSKLDGAIASMVCAKAFSFFHVQ